MQAYRYRQLGGDTLGWDHKGNKSPQPQAVWSPEEALYSPPTTQMTSLGYIFVASTPPSYWFFLEATYPVLVPLGYST